MVDSGAAAAGGRLEALLPQRFRKLSASLAIVSMLGAFLLSLCAFAHAVQHSGHDGAKEFYNFEWLQFAAGDAGVLKLGWMLDPLTAVMLVMVTFVGTLIFIYSTGYMAHDDNFTRFFTFLSLFAAAMLGIVIANSLLLLFHELGTGRPRVVSAHRLLVSQTQRGGGGEKSLHHHPHRRCVFFLGIMWLYHASGTLLFYDNGNGLHGTDCADENGHAGDVRRLGGPAAIGILIFIGAMGKSGQCRCTSGCRTRWKARPRSAR